MDYKSFNLLIGLLSTSILVAGCGGGGSSDETTGGTSASVPATSTAPKATITADNYKDLAIASTEAVKHASDSATPASPKTLATSQLKNLTIMQNQAITTDNTSLTNAQCTVSGSASVTLNDSPPVTITTTYSNCTNEQVRIDGSTTIVQQSSTEYTISYNNFTIESLLTGGTTIANGTSSCTEDNFDDICVHSSDYSVDISLPDFEGELGNRTYTFDGSLTAIENSDGSYNVDATVVDPTHGAVDLDANNVSFGSCFTSPGGQPDSGVIDIVGDGSVTAVVTFIDCQTFSVDFNGAIDTISWSTI